MNSLVGNASCVLSGFPGGSDSKKSSCNAGGLGSILGLGRSPGGGHGNPLQFSCLENPHGQEPGRTLVHGVAESDMTEHLSTHVYYHTLLSGKLNSFTGGSGRAVPQVMPVVKNLPANAGDIREKKKKREREMGSIPGSERFPGGGYGNPFQYSCLENPMDTGAWRAMVHRVTKRHN